MSCFYVLNDGIMRLMTGLKETKQLVLYCLSFETNLFGERKSDGYVPYLFLYRRLPLKPASIRNAVAQMTRSGEINKLISNRQTLISLSALGRKQLQQWTPALFPTAKAGSGFILALFLAPTVLRQSQLPARTEAIRNLRGRLQSLGFIKLQRGVYCGWKDLAQRTERIILKSGLSSYLLLIPFEETRLFKAHDLSYKLLKLQYLTWSCQELINQLNPLLKIIQPGKAMKIKANSAVKQVIKESFIRLKKLPNLPKNLTPPGWSITDLKTKLKRVSDAIAD